MRTATLTGILFVALGYAADAQQFTLAPQLGFENSRTTIRYNEIRCYAPLGAQASPHLGARLEYTSRKGQGVFGGLATDRSVIAVQLADPSAGMKPVESSLSGMRLHFEGGYQFTSKPIYFTKSGAHSKRSTQQQNDKSLTQRRCGGYAAGSRCHRSLMGVNSIIKLKKDKGWYVRIKPIAGIAFAPAIKTDVSAITQGTQTGYVYRAGNWKTALVTGAGFEFGKNVDRKLMISINYLKGIGNLGQRTITTASEGKTMITNIKSGASGWNITAGIPISLNNKKPAAVKSAMDKKTSNPERRCGQYRGRCTRVI